jgi:K+-sensing histidine kinase KdpD
MWMPRITVSIAASLAIVCIVTTILWYLRLGAAHLSHPVFMFLPVIALVAFFYGSLPALLCASAAAASAAFFLYSPVFSFDVANRLEVGDLICFVVLALIGVKCAVKLLQPSPQMPAPKSRYDRP